MAGTFSLFHVKLQVFLSGLKSNKTLGEVAPSEKDMRKELSASKDKARAREKLDEVIANINQILKDNKD